VPRVGDIFWSRCGRACGQSYVVAASCRWSVGLLKTLTAQAHIGKANHQDPRQGCSQDLSVGESYSDNSHKENNGYFRRQLWFVSTQHTRLSTIRPTAGFASGFGPPFLSAFGSLSSAYSRPLGLKLL